MIQNASAGEIHVHAVPVRADVPEVLSQNADPETLKTLSPPSSQLLQTTREKLLVRAGSGTAASVYVRVEEMVTVGHYRGHQCRSHPHPPRHGIRTGDRRTTSSRALFLAVPASAVLPVRDVAPHLGRYDGGHQHHDRIRGQQGGRKHELEERDPGEPERDGGDHANAPGSGVFQNRHSNFRDVTHGSLPGEWVTL